MPSTDYGAYLKNSKKGKAKKYKHGGKVKKTSPGIKSFRKTGGTSGDLTPNTDHK